MKQYPCPLCPSKFDAVVALDFHLRREHPGAVEVQHEMILRLYREERAAKRKEEELPPGKLHPKLDALYRSGCPCGRSYKDHVEARKEMGATA